MAKGLKTGGREKGTLNKFTAEVKSLAQQHGAEAIEVLRKIMQESDNEPARIAAAKELLDRGYGRSKAEDEPIAPQTGITINIQPVAAINGRPAHLIAHGGTIPTSLAG